MFSYAGDYRRRGNKMQFVIDNWALFLALVVILVLLLSDPIKRKIFNIEVIGVNDVPRLTGHKDAVVVDVREIKEFQGGHIPKAVNLPLSGLTSNLNKLDKYKGKPLILSCRTTNRSMRAAGILAKRGYEQIHVLQGGFMAWSKENLPVEK